MMPLTSAIPTDHAACCLEVRARLRPAAAGRISSALISMTPTHRMESMTASATSTTKPHSISRVRMPLDRARKGSTLVISSALYRRNHRISVTPSASSRYSWSCGATARMSPISSEEYFANCPPRARISRPAAMEVEEKTEMMVSVEAEPDCLIRQIRIAHTTPKISMASRSFRRPRMIPRPMPVSAECPSASEKKAIWWFTAIVPSRPSIGVSSSTASRAFFMKLN